VILFLASSAPTTAKPLVFSVDLARIEQELAETEERVARGESDLADQRELVAIQRRRGQPSGPSEDLLELLQRTLALLIEERDRLRDGLRRFTGR
jgi:hypothetical protein